MDILFQQLYGMASMTAMDAKIEEQLQHQHSAEDRECLQAIYESNDLDERGMLCASRLGYHQQAEYLATRLAMKKARPAQTVHDDPSSW